MNGNEERLNQYIDAINAGRSPVSTTVEPELADLFRTVDHLHDLREPAWPPESFAVEMAHHLSAQLTAAFNGRTVLVGEASEPGVMPATPWTRSAEDVPRLQAFPARVSRFRRGLQVAGALAAFSVFALALVLIFGGLAGDDSGTSGAVPGNDARVGQIAFTGIDSGNLDIYLVRTDGTDFARLTDSPAMDILPDWSPDGSRIAFTSDRDGSDQIYVMNADGSDVTRITDGRARYAAPKWSPDATRIAALMVEPNAPDDVQRLVVMQSNGTGVQPISDGGVIYSFEWSPDGSEIAAAVGLSGLGPQVLVFASDGSEARTFYLANTFRANPQWSPDGSQLAMVETTDITGERGRWISVLDRDGQGGTEIYRSHDLAGPFDWSLDGEQLAVVAATAGADRGIVIVPIEQSNSAMRLDDTSADDSYPLWSPGSEQLAFLRLRSEQNGIPVQSLMVVNADGSNLVEVAANAWGVAPHSWRPE